MSIIDYNKNRIINVSNRLPVRIVKGEEYRYECSEGGLATGLSSVFSESGHIWVGWPGTEIHAADQQQIMDDLGRRKLHPVFLSASEISQYYEGFSNGTLWPLFHYFGPYSNYDPVFWESYVSVNQKFADEIVRMATADDIIWIHDYQLMLVPAMVREQLPDAVIGYFQHIPFPAYEMLRALPWRSELVNGLLGADTIGFQTEEDVACFRQAVVSLLSCREHDHGFFAGARSVRVDAFPISIDYQKFSRMALAPETLKAEEKITRIAHTKLVLSVDRLDYSKGILQRLKAFEAFLQQHPEWIRKVTLIHLVVPSRDNVCDYRELKHEMDRLITEINGKYATIGWQPIHHFYRSFQPNMLTALYKTAHVALVTPLRDGMNLVCKEYVASNVSKDGVLVLGEAAGAAKELTEALQVNPNDIESFAAAIHTALTMPEAERRQRMEAMQRKVRDNDIFKWMQDFMETLQKQAQKQVLVCPLLTDKGIMQIRHSYRQGKSRLFLLDYDGTLMPFHSQPEQAAPDQSLLLLLARLSSVAGNRVVIISGRDRETLDKWLGGIPVGLIAEHGAFYKQHGGKWMGIPGLKQDWKKDIRSALEMFTAGIPGSFIEEKNYSIAWHYRSSERTLVGDRLPAIITMLRTQIQNRNLDMLQGSKVIEIKSNLVNKGKAATSILARHPSAFVLAAGDDVTDEDMFRPLYGKAITVKIGSNISAATYCLKSFEQLRDLLTDLATCSQRSNLQLITTR